MGRPATAIPSAFEHLGRRRAVAVVLLTVVLIAALAGSLSGTARGTASLQGGPASVAMSIAVTLVGFLLAGVAALMFWAAATRRRGSGGRAEAVPTPFWRRIAPGLLFLAIIWVALLLGHPHAHPVRTGAIPPRTATPKAAGHSVVHFVPAASFTTLGAVALVVAVALVWSWARARGRGKAWNLGAVLRSRAAAIVGTPASTLLAATLADVHVADPDEEADPRRAVVAAYVAMTHAAALAGAARQAHETPSEFLQQLLSSFGASHAAAGRLTQLFEAARYSTKPFDETHRLDAIHALRQLQAELNAPVTSALPDDAGAASAGPMPGPFGSGLGVVGP